MPSATVKITETGDMEAVLQKLPILLRTTALRKALSAGGRVVAKRAKQLAPRSVDTGTRAMWSQSTRASRSGVKPLRDTIGVVVRDYGQTWVCVVGPQYPAGALGHLIEFGHDEILFGRKTGRRVAPKPFLRPAADETADQVNGVIIATLTKELEAAK